MACRPWLLPSWCCERPGGDGAGDDPRLFAQVGEEPRDQREDDAEDDAGGKRKIDGGVLAAPGDVAGQAAEREAGLAEEQDQDADGGDEEAHADEEASEVAHPFRVQGAGYLAQGVASGTV